MGVPCLLWGSSGAVLAWKHWTTRAPPGNPAAVAGGPGRAPFVVDPAQAVRATGHGGVPVALRWTWLLGAPRYEVQFDDALLVIDGRIPVLVAPADEALSRRVALADAPAGVHVVAVAQQERPTLVFRPRRPLAQEPAYRVTLSNGDDVYVSRTTGQVQAHVDDVYRLLRVSFFALHMWDLSPTRRDEPRRASFLLLMGMATALLLLGASGLLLALPRRWRG